MTMFPTKEDNKPESMKEHSIDELLAIHEDITSIVGSDYHNIDSDTVVEGEIVVEQTIDEIQNELGGKLINLLEHISGMPLDAWKPYVTGKITEMVYEDLQYIVDNANDVIRLMKLTQELMPNG